MGSIVASLIVLQFLAIGGYLEAEGRSKTVAVVIAAVFVLLWSAVIAFLIFDRVVVGGD
jgi:Na+-translocating ferredoxin:NAD+ oxidoreductase RnfA subunit